MAPDDILRTAAEIRALTNKPFALNLWVSNHDDGGDRPRPDEVRRMHARLRPFYDELGLDPPVPPNKVVHRFEDQAHAVLEARPAVFSFVAGVPSAEIIREAKRRGIVLAGGATTLDEARVLDGAGIDLVVAAGFEAGGHRPSFLAAAEDSLAGTLSLTAQVAAALSRPVIAAGGIANARGVAAAMQLGAGAAQVGTAFLACDESGAPPLHRDLLFREEAQRTVLTRAYSGRLARGIRNRVHDALHATRLLPFPAQGWLIGALREAALRQHRADLVSMWCGQSAGLLRWRTAAQVMASLTEGLS
jgi:nitronate monooxygenase